MLIEEREELNGGEWQARILKSNVDGHKFKRRHVEERQEIDIMLALTSALRRREHGEILVCREGNAEALGLHFRTARQMTKRCMNSAGYANKWLHYQRQGCQLL